MNATEGVRPYGLRCENALTGVTILLAACASIPKSRSAVDSVDIEGGEKVNPSAVKDRIATQQSPKFLGLFRGLVYEYAFYDQTLLETDLERIQRYYQSRGYYDVQVRAARIVRVSDKHVRVVIEVREGIPVGVKTLKVLGVSHLPKGDRDAVAGAVLNHIKKGDAFDEEKFEAAQNAILVALTNRGYAYAKLDRKAQIDLPHHSVDVVFSVVPNEKAVYGNIAIEGLGDLPEGPVRRALNLKRGNVYSTTELHAAQQALLDLGVFTSVDIRPVLASPPPASHEVPIYVKASVSKLRSIRLGGGFELDVVRTDVHLRGGWRNQNFLGGFREFETDVQPGVVLYPTRINNLVAPTNYLPEIKSRMRLRQPGFLEARTNGLLRAEYNVYPVLLGTNQDNAQTVPGYQEVRGAAGVDRTLWKFFASPMYNIQANFPFAYIGENQIDTVLVSYVSLLTTLDFRNNRIFPRRGAYFSNELQTAGGPLGGDASDIRTQLEARFFVPLRSRMTLAIRGSLGFLFASNYGDTRTSSGSVTEGSSLAEQNRDTQLMFFRGFYAGGPSSNRGYPLRGIGPQGPVPFLLSPGAVGCTPESTDSQCVLPLGGFTLWEFSTELRFPITGNFTGAAFCDMADVSPDKMDIRLYRPHLSCGLGARYSTPVGPVRFDVGYRIPGLQTFGGPPAETPGTILGMPIAIAFGIGEAY